MNPVQFVALDTIKRNISKMVSNVAISSSLHLGRSGHLARGKRAISLATLVLVGGLVGCLFSYRNSSEHCWIRQSGLVNDHSISAWFRGRNDIGDLP